MLARISTEFNTTPDQFWRWITQPSSFEFVTAPLLQFTPAGDWGLGQEWDTQRSYELKISLLGIIPLGHHSIVLETIDRESNRIISSERGDLARVWKHTIQFVPVGQGKIKYTDEIVLEAGWLTPLIWLFAHIFYRHRQRRWRRLLKEIPRKP